MGTRLLMTRHHFVAETRLPFRPANRLSCRNGYVAGGELCLGADYRSLRARRKQFGILEQFSDIKNQPAFERQYLLAPVFADDLTAESSFELVDFEQRLIGRSGIPAAEVKVPQTLLLVANYIAPDQIAVGAADGV